MRGAEDETAAGEVSVDQGEEATHVGVSGGGNIWDDGTMFFKTFAHRKSKSRECRRSNCKQQRKGERAMNECRKKYEKIFDA